MTDPPSSPPPSPPSPGDEPLVEAAAAAYRPRDPRGAIAFLPAWHDLDAAGREKAFELARALRTLEAAADPRGLSSTGKAVLARLRASGGERR